MIEGQIRLELHAGVYVAVTRVGPKQYRVSTTVMAAHHPPRAHWQFTQPRFNISLSSMGRVVHRGVDCVNGQVANNACGEQETDSAHVGPLAPGEMALVEFLIEVDESPGDITPPPELHVVQDFHDRRLSGAALMGAQTPIAAPDPSSGFSPQYWVLCDDAPDDDPETEFFVADVLEEYPVGILPGSREPCAHDWCLGTHPVLMAEAQ